VARLILDTAVLIASERTGRQVDRLIADEDDVAIAAITAAELLVGVELADGKHRAARAAYVHSVLETVPVEGYDLSVARAHATLLGFVRKDGTPRGAHDLVIAATAVATSRLLVSTDTSAFVGLPGLALKDVV
jgi:tRNA(fMet)-specific endonuclease VapC